MAFSLTISRTGAIHSSKIWYLEGVLQSGTIKRGDTAFMTVDGKYEKVIVSSVALSNGYKKISTTYFFIAIEKPNFRIDQVLDGDSLIST